MAGFRRPGDAQRAANRDTARTNVVHDVKPKSGFLGRRTYEVRNTGRIANPVERRIARTSRW